MRRHAIPVTLACLVGVSLLLGAQTQSASSPPKGLAGLEGTRWSVIVTPDETAMSKGEKIYNDTLVFSGGKVTMNECVAYGFGATAYTAAKSGDSWSFSTDQASEKEGKTRWTAEMKADSVKGTLVWTKKDGTVFNYTFGGKKEMK